MGIFDGFKKPGPVTLTAEQQRIRDMLNQSPAHHGGLLTNPIAAGTLLHDTAAQHMIANAPSVSAFDLARQENPDLNSDYQKQQRRQQVIKRMADDAEATEKQVVGITQSWLRITKGFSPRALAEALGHDKEALDHLRLALMLAPAYEPDQEKTSDPSAP